MPASRTEAGFFMKYITKAKKLNEAGFWMAGYGHFDITTEELGNILEMIEKENFEGIRILYENLERERL